jgi:hypothetical protein
MGKKPKVGTIITMRTYKNGTHCASETKDKLSPHNVKKICRANLLHVSNRHQFLQMN